jgi:putative ATPase
MGNETNHTTPLAERMRPTSLAEYVGQEHLVGEKGILFKALKQKHIFSMILWGPAGVGKTTLARLIAQEIDAPFVSFSAVFSGVKEIRAVVAAAKEELARDGRATILFVDEIHRFNKAQQDAFLPHLESGLLTLIGATTENPSFEVIAPLLSRARVLTLKPLAREAITAILRRAAAGEAGRLGIKIAFSEAATAALAELADGDARSALNNLELIIAAKSSEAEALINTADVGSLLERKALSYDKNAEEHYNLISALHKSVRSSDVNAALYWLWRMLESGEDRLFIARRLIRMAIEDVGNADPRALTLALAAKDTYHFLGSPEGELALAQAAVYLACAPKSNAIYLASNKVKATIAQTGTIPVPLPLRNAPTRLMKELGYAKGYKYDHDFTDAYAGQECLPDPIRGASFYEPTGRGLEKTIAERMEYFAKLKAGMNKK